MKINVQQLINQVSKHPQIYNPDHKDFNDTQIVQAIFNSSISKEMNGIKGEILHRKWSKILYKYASFIRKLSNDDSSEKVLEKFMEWPWTKPMRIFKPYVRKQFQIPEFQPGPVQGIEIHLEDMPQFQTASTSEELQSDLMASGSTVELQSDLMASGSTVDLQSDLMASGSTVERPSMSSRPSTRHEFPLRNVPELAMIGPDYHRSTVPVADSESNPRDLPPALHLSPIHQRVQLPSYIENLIISTVSNQIQLSEENRQDLTAFHTIASIMGLDQPQNDGDDDTDISELVTDEEMDVGQENDADVTPEDGLLPQPKRIKLDGPSVSAGHNDDGTVDKSDNGTEKNGGTDVLPDIPQPIPQSKRAPWEFTAQEHIFLAWAKTMSTFTAKRQATIKMKINKIMSEAEFEDLDDEFFAANSPPRRPIYTSRR